MKKLFAVRDVKADSFGAPMAIATEGLARRSFLEACLQANSELAKYKDDYILYEIGEYDPNSGSITGVHPAPRLIISASGILAQWDAERNKVEPMLPLEKGGVA